MMAEDIKSRLIRIEETIKNMKKSTDKLYKKIEGNGKNGVIDNVKDLHEQQTIIKSQIEDHFKKHEKRCENTFTWTRWAGKVIPQIIQTILLIIAFIVGVNL